MDAPILPVRDGWDETVSLSRAPPAAAAGPERSGNASSAVPLLRTPRRSPSGPHETPPGSLAWWVVRRLALPLVALALLLGGGAAPPAAPPAPPPGTAPGDLPPELTVPGSVRATVGGIASAGLGAHDPEGGPVELTATGLPPGAAITGFRLTWEPLDAGTWPVAVRATDAGGGEAHATILLVARWPDHPGALVGLGDSVASGHGLSWRDYLGRDRCWRAEDEAYPRLVRDRWEVERGGGDGFALVACSGATAADLLEEPVGGGLPGTGPDGGGPLPQVEWAVRANPGLVTVTVGANDLRFTHPDESLDADGRVDAGAVTERLGGLADSLDRALRRLVEATDAVVVVTGYHDPTAERPHGVPGCEETCFRQAAAEVVARLNRTLRTVADRFPAERVRFADVAPAFEGHAAPNGLGPDGWRSGDLPGPLGDLFEATTGGTSPYCAVGHPDGDPWVSSLDCVHPNGAGARAYADAVRAAWQGT